MIEFIYTHYEFVLPVRLLLLFNFFFFNDTATTEIYTLSLHDALPIYHVAGLLGRLGAAVHGHGHVGLGQRGRVDRKSTRLNSSHTVISYAVFCLKKKKIVTYGTISYSRTTTPNPPYTFTLTE